MIALIAAFALQSPPPDVQAMMNQIDPARLRATVEKLASYQTRNTNHPMLLEAAEWLAGEYRKIPGLQVELMRYTLPAGRRVPEEKDVLQVVARLPGKDDRIILVGGHIDSLSLRDRSPDTRAPGANDDASGTALALELARVLSQRKWEHTLVFVAFSGEEQGLLGAKALAQRAKEEGWKIDAMLNNDTIGSSSNLNGQSDTARVRLFSELSEDHDSRELARFIEWATRDKVPGFNVKLVFRRDRFGRGGDHTPFATAGFAAVRFVERHEEYTRQHTPEDLPQYVDFNHLANVTRLNLVAMAGLADAGPPPANVRIGRRQSHDTTLTWESKPGVKYVVYWRETTSPVWQWSREVGETDTVTLEKVSKDDHEYAVGAVGGLPVAAR